MENIKLPNTRLDVSKLLSGEEDKLTFEVEPQPGIDDPDIKILSVRFSGEAKEIGGFIELNGTISCRFAAHCARCLEELERDLSVEVNVTAIEQDKLADDSDPDQIPITDGSVDLDALCFEQLAVNLPLRVLCRDDCKGLCFKCGQNLNISECGCDRRQTDLRLEGLMDFFKQ